MTLSRSCIGHDPDHVTPEDLLHLRHTLAVKVVPPHHVLERLLTQVGVDEVLPLRCPDSSVDLGGRLPAKETSHFLVNDPHDLVIVNNAVGRAEMVVHETDVRVCIGIGEYDVIFQRIDTAVGEDVGILDVAAGPAPIGGLDGMQQPEDLPCLLFEAQLPGLQ
ncbi:hypothetical protein VUR80DRAFT_8924 [Thermomyces stellatus]